MTARPIPEHIRAAAVADYHASGESYAAVAARHGISSSRLHRMVNPQRPVKSRDEEIRYAGSSTFNEAAWELRGGVRYPLFPERRSSW